MIHQLHSVRSNRAGFECLGQLAKATRHLFADELELDMSRVSSFDANMAAPLGVVLARVTEKFNYVRIASLPVAVKEILANSHFLSHFWYRRCADASPAKMPFRRFRLTDEGAFEERQEGRPWFPELGLGMTLWEGEFEDTFAAC